MLQSLGSQGVGHDLATRQQHVSNAEGACQTKKEQEFEFTMN